MRLFLDTNVLTDLIMARGEGGHAARGLIEMSQGRACDLLVSSLALKDASYIIEESKYTKALVPSREERRLLAFKGRELLLKTCIICPVDELICRRAQANRNEPDYDDALIAECAEVNEADAIVSGDRKAFNNASVPKLSSVDALKLVRTRLR